MLVSGVDGQGSFGNGIILQVLGELSNKGGPAQKFVQTFFLAEQLGGYYVLNDLFRYLKEDLDDDEEEEETILSQENHADPATVVISSQEIHDQAPISEEKPAVQTAVEASVPVADLTAATEETVTMTQVQESQATAGDAKKTGEKKSAERKTEKKTADKKTEKKAADKKDIKADDSIQEKSEAMTPTDIAMATPDETANDSAAAVGVENAATAVRAASPAPAPAAPQPPKQKTWANLAANNSTQWGSQVAAAKAGAVSAPVTAPAVPTSAPKAPAASQASQTPRPRTNGREEYHSIYIKNVTERMSLTQLREAFTKFGSVTHLEYTQKKNCAFLDFSTAEAMNAALKQNTVPVGNEMVLAEERRRNSNSTNGGPRTFNNHQGGPQSQGHNGPRGGGARVNNARGGGPSDRKPVQGNNNRAEKATPAVAAK